MIYSGKPTYALDDEKPTETFQATASVDVPNAVCDCAPERPRQVAERDH